MTKLWLNGALLSAAEARIDPADRGFTLGDGVFETIRAIAGTPAHLPRHLARLHAGAQTLGIDIPVADAALSTAIASVADGQDCALRLTLTRGPMPRGVLPAGTSRATMLITAGPLPPPPSPIHAVTAASTRRNQHSPLARIKSLNYGDSILARQEASARGAGDAILLNTAGDIAEASASNIILLLQGRCVTPRIEDGALPGITRARLIEAGLLVEARLTPQDAAGAEAACLTNSLATTMLLSLDGRKLNPSHPALQQVAQESAL